MATKLVVKLERGDWYGCQHEGHPEQYRSLEIWKNDNSDFYQIHSISVFCEISDSKKTYEDAIKWMLSSADRIRENDEIFHPGEIMPEFKFYFGPAFPGHN